MFWAGSIVLRYTIALLLNTFLILLLKFSFDRCTANMGYHIFISDKPLPDAICQPVSRWVINARTTDSMQNGGNRGAFDQPSRHWLVSMMAPGTSLSNSLGIDTLPMTLVAERTAPRVTKLLLFWLIPPFILALIVEVIISFRDNR